MTATLALAARKAAAAALIVAALVGGTEGLARVTGATAPVPVQAVELAGVQEDDARWNCATMGNRRCGPGNRHPRTGQPIARGAYERVPRSWRGLRVERVNRRGTFRVTRHCVRHARDGSPVVCPKRGVGTS